MNYRSIRNLDELEQAISGTDAKLRKMRKRLKHHYELAKDFYSPTNSSPFYGVLLSLLSPSRKRKRLK